MIRELEFRIFIYVMNSVEFSSLSAPVLVLFGSHLKCPKDIVASGLLLLLVLVPD